MIEFLLNTEQVRLEKFPADLTVLEYLRNGCRLTGTKQGCASGDCGACTVVVAEPVGGKLRYRSINSCITLLGSLHGKQLLTVEHLADGKTLHPVQQAMVDCHASQCGFCTPGFVMSLFACYKQGGSVDRHRLEVALGGNLCRCTGYRPIVEAGLKACQDSGPDQFSQSEADVSQYLTSITAPVPADFFIPASLVELATALAGDPEIRPVCGGTDLALEITQQLQSLPKLAYFGSVPELNHVEVVGQTLNIGAAVPYTDCFDMLVELWPDLEELLLRLGSTPIRNQGSIGGNVANASPIGDMPPVLIALGASLQLRLGERLRSLPVEDFFVSYKKTQLLPGEFIQSISIPLPEANEKLFCFKNSKRFDDDISTALGIFNLRVDEDYISRVRVAFGGMAEIPKRAPGLEAMLMDKNVHDDFSAGIATALASDFQPIDDVRASARYRLEVAAGFVQRLMNELNSPEEPHRVNRYG